MAIGRNEGERLARCLNSALLATERIVYVDSGSNDGSIELARRLRVEVVELDLALPFTAGRARNAGFARLLARWPELSWVQFVDGDCELVEGFIDKALAHLQAHPRAAVVCGRRRERAPEHSVYNHLCDMEWDTPPGRAHSCGGDFLIRASAFRAVSGFTPDIIAGEEPDLCFRLRQAGFEVWRIPEEMTRHDAGMDRFEQWWKRNVRAGHSYAEAARRHGFTGEHRGLRAMLSNFVWASPAAWVFWPLLFWRVYRRRGDAAYAAFTVLGKLPQSQGQLKYWLNQARGHAASLIEYK